MAALLFVCLLIFVVPAHVGQKVVNADGADTVALRLLHFGASSHFWREHQNVCLFGDALSVGAAQVCPALNQVSVAGAGQHQLLALPLHWQRESTSDFQSFSEGIPFLHEHWQAGRHGTRFKHCAEIRAAVNAFLHSQQTAQRRHLGNQVGGTHHTNTSEWPVRSHQARQRQLFDSR